MADRFSNLMLILKFYIVKWYHEMCSGELTIKYVLKNQFNWRLHISSLSCDDSILINVNFSALDTILCIFLCLKFFEIKFQLYMS